MAQAGRYPFLTWSDRYLAARANWFSDITLGVKRRVAHAIQRALSELRAAQLVSTMDPVAITPQDVAALIRHWQTRGLDSVYILKLMVMVKAVTEFAGNTAVARLKMQGFGMPRRIRKEIETLNMDEIRKIWTAADGIEGWWGDITRFMVHFYPFTGVRPSELRRAHVEDINTTRWEFYVRHPKGEFHYGEKRTVPILLPARAATLAFLAARERMFAGRSTPLLCPTVCNGVMKEYSENSFRRMKREVEKRAGLNVDFSIKTFRSSYCQMNIDKDSRLLPAVSHAMGHGSTTTTERYYGRIRQESANSALNDAWALSPPEDI